MPTTTVFPLLRGIVCNYCNKVRYWFLLRSTSYFYWCILLCVPVAEKNCHCYGCNICRCCGVWVQSSFQRVLSILWWAVSTSCSKSLGLLETTGTELYYDPESMDPFSWIYCSSLYWLLLRSKTVALTAKVEVPYFWAKLVVKTCRCW